VASHTSKVLPAFDFRVAEALPISQRIVTCLERAREIVAENGYGDYAQAPCVPDAGASEIELQVMETQLGVPLPAEYRRFLSICRYLKLSDGTEIGGLSHEGLYVTEVPWLSSEHREGVEYLVFANYWQYADGDQLMFDMTDPSTPVIAYLHEHGPLFEFYAPSFSLALWRLVHEGADGG
jgi:hypothetical protein